MNAQILNTYLWAVISLLVGVTFVLYAWLKEIIDFKIKAFFYRGTGRVWVDSVGTFHHKFVKVAADSNVKIDGKDFWVDPLVPSYKMFGVPAVFFVGDVPKNLDLYKGSEMYDGIRTDDIDSHVANMFKAGYLEWFVKWKNMILAVFVILTAVTLASAFFDYQVWDWIKKGLELGAENILLPK